MRNVIPVVLKEMLALPTAAFVEHAVLDYVRARCGAMPGVSLRSDRYGNLLVRYRNQPRGTTPLVFTAHTDHPGFVARGMRDSRTLLAEFRGWVDPSYFVGTGVRFWSAGRWVKGRVSAITRAGKMNKLTGRTAPPEELAILVRQSVEPGAAGMWDLPEAALRGRHVHARGCDDVAGAASLVALLERLSRRRARAETYCLFTRAEEVGFIGAIGAARIGTVPRRLPIIAIETSKALPSAPQGDGPILRVGDRSSIFDPALTEFCHRVAQDVARRRPTFKFQRKLMDGGTCESTAYAAYGYRATGLCVALGHYHNMDDGSGVPGGAAASGRKRIASETIHLGDWERMVDWYEALVKDRVGFRARDGALRTRMDQRFAEFESLLS